MEPVSEQRHVPSPAPSGNSDSSQIGSGVVIGGVETWFSVKNSAPSAQVAVNFLK